MPPVASQTPTFKITKLEYNFQQFVGFAQMLLHQKDVSHVPLKKVLPISDLMDNGLFASVMKIPFVCHKKKSWISQNILSLPLGLP